MARPPQEISIASIAREAGVSAATVSRVINRRAGISEETRQRVNALLQQYNYVTNYAQVRTPRIAAIIPRLNFGEYVRRALAGLYRYAQANRLMVNLIIAEGCRDEGLFETVRDQQCSGVVALLPSIYWNAIGRITSSELPIVIVDHEIDDPGAGFISNDSYSGSVAALQHLLALGHRRIGYLQYHTPSLNQIQRFKGYENTMRAAGLPIAGTWVMQAEPNPGGIRGMDGLLATRRLLDQAPELSALMAVDDTMAMGALTAIHERGLRIPEDISIIGFDNCPECEVWHPALTTVNHPIEQAGEQAIAAVHTALRNPGTWTPPREILPTSLVVRRSTGPAKG